MLFPLFKWLFESGTLWMIVLVMVSLMTLAHEIGFLIYQTSHPHPHDKKDSIEGKGYILSASLGLLALLLGFSFSMAVNRYDARRLLIVDEANAVGTSYLRAQFLSEPYKSELSRLYLDYVNTRLMFFASNRTKDSIAQAAHLTSDLHSQIWRTTLEGIRPLAYSEVSGELMTSTNQVIDLASAQTAALKASVPIFVLSTLGWYTFIVSFLMGYILSGNRQIHRVTALGMFLLVAMTIALIIDLDRPGRGITRLSSDPLLNLKSMIVSYETHKRRYGQ